MTANTPQTPALRHPITGRLDVVAAIANYLNTLGRPPAVLHLTQRQWDAFQREAVRHPSLDLTPIVDSAGDIALSCQIDGVRHVVPFEIVEIEASAGVTAYRAQYARENDPAVANHNLSGASTHA